MHNSEKQQKHECLLLILVRMPLMAQRHSHQPALDAFNVCLSVIFRECVVCDGCFFTLVYFYCYSMLFRLWQGQCKEPVNKLANIFVMSVEFWN